jgi:integrase
VATFEKRGKFWRVKIRRARLPARTRTFDNKTLAQQWARSVEAGIDNGVVVDRRLAERTSLAEILERYRREVTPTKRGAADENLRLKAMALRLFARIRMAALTSSHLATYRDDRLKVVSGATVNREFNVLSHAIDTARREWDIYLPVNPCALVRRPPQGRPRNRRLQGEEEQRLLAVCRTARNPWLVHFVALAIETGMRRGELLGLQWSNVDLEKRTGFLRSPRTGSRAAYRCPAARSPSYAPSPPRQPAVCLASSRSRRSSSPSAVLFDGRVSLGYGFTTCDTKRPAAFSRRG